MRRAKSYGVLADLSGPVSVASIRGVRITLHAEDAARLARLTADNLGRGLLVDFGGSAPVLNPIREVQGRDGNLRIFGPPEMMQQLAQRLAASGVPLTQR